MNSSAKDRVTVLPEAVTEPLRQHLAAVKLRHEQAVRRHHVFPDTVQKHV